MEIPSQKRSAALNAGCSDVLPGALLLQLVADVVLPHHAQEDLGHREDHGLLAGNALLGPAVRSAAEQRSTNTLAAMPKNVNDVRWRA